MKREPSVTAIYCEDVRFEIGGKVSLMGVFGHDTMMPGFPINLAKLVALVEVTISPDSEVKSLQFQLLKDREIIAGSDVPPSDIAKLQEEALQEDGDDKVVPIRMMFQFEQLHFEKPASIRAAVILNGVELLAPRLSVRNFTDNERARANAGPEMTMLPSIVK